MTGVFAAIFQTIALFAMWAPDTGRLFSPLPFALITVASVSLYNPVYAMAGAVGAAVRRRIAGLRRASAEPAPDRAPGLTPERLQWAGIAAGVLILLIGSRASAQVAPSSLFPPTLISAFAAGLVAVFLSLGGALGGGFRKTSARSSALHDQDRDGDGRSYCELQ